jgi:hypothetical protein
MSNPVGSFIAACCEWSARGDRLKFNWKRIAVAAGASGTEAIANLVLQAREDGRRLGRREAAQLKRLKEKKA